MHRHVGGMLRRVTRDGSASHACVESGTGSVSARAAAGDFGGVTSDGGASTGWFDPEAFLNSAEWLGAVSGAEVGEVRTGLGKVLAVDFLVVIDL